MVIVGVGEIIDTAQYRNILHGNIVSIHGQHVLFLTLLYKSLKLQIQIKLRPAYWSNKVHFPTTKNTELKLTVWKCLLLKKMLTMFSCEDII